MNKNYNFSQFEIMKELSPSVFLALHKPSQNLYSMRILTEREQEPFLSIVKRITHPNIQAYVASWTSKGKVYVIHEWELRGDLQQYLSQRTQYLEETEIWSLITQLAQAILYLESNSIVHRDIKPANIFVGQSLRIGDFGIATPTDAIKAPERIPQRVFPFGTPMYCAPEVIKHQLYSHKIDVWALGCVLYQLMMLRPPFQGDTLQSLSYQIIYRPFPKIQESYSYELRNLVTQMLEKDPSKRLSAQQVQDYILTNQNKRFTLDTIKVSVLQHTKIEEQDSKQMEQKAYRTHTSMQNSTVPAMNIEESLIIDQQFKQCEPDDVNLFLQLNKSPSLDMPYKRPHTANNNTAMNNGITIAKIQHSTGVVKSGLDLQKALFNQIRIVRPNSAVSLTGKEYIAHSLVRDIQQKRQIREITKPSAKVDWQFQSERAHQQDEDSIIKKNRRPNTAISSYRLKSQPKLISQRESILRNTQMSQQYSEDQERRFLIKKSSQEWQNRILSALSKKNDTKTKRNDTSSESK